MSRNKCARSSSATRQNDRIHQQMERRLTRPEKVEVAGSPTVSSGRPGKVIFAK